MSSDTNVFDTTEKVDILVKTAFGFPSADESRAWYEETTVPFNDYSVGEDILIDKIPAIPDFNTNGIVRSAADIGLVSSNFVNYAATGDKSLCSIVDDSTGVIRRIRLLILDETPQLATPGASWYKLNSNNVNVIKDAFQFNYKKYTDANNNIQQPYLYKVNTQKSTNATLPFGAMGGNWFIDLKSGILFFPDFGNFSNGTQTNTNFRVNVTDNKPVLTIYTYVGRKGTPKIVDFGDDTYRATLSPQNNQLFVNTATNSIARYSNSQWISVGGSTDAAFSAIETNIAELDVSVNALILRDSVMDASLNLKSDRTYVDASLNLKSDRTYVDASLNLKSAVTYVDSSLNLKSAVTYVDASLNLKSAVTYVDASLNLKSAITYVDSSLNLKPSFTQVDASLNLKSAITYVDASLNLKSAITYVDASLNLKANLASPIFTGTVTAPKLISGDASFNGNVDISGVLSVKQTVNSVVTNTTINNYNVSVTNDLSLNGKLLVSSDVSLNSKLYVKGDASFNGRIDICGNIFAPTAGAGTNTTQLATTAFVTNAVSTKADITYVDSSLNLKPSFTQVDASLNLKPAITYVDASLNLKPAITYVDASLNLKSDRTYVDSSLNLKSDRTYVDSSLNLKPSFTQVDSSLNLKSDRTYVDSSLNLKPSFTQVDASLNLKSAITYVDASLNLKSAITYVDASLNLKPAITYVDASLNLKSAITYVDSSLNLKPAITYVDSSLNLKPSFTQVDASLNLKSAITYVDSSLNLKSAITYVDASLNLKPSFTQVDASLNLKPAITYVDASLNLKPSFTQVDASLNLKSAITYVDSSLNLKPSFTQVDSSLNLKPSFTQVDASLNLKPSFTQVDSSLNLKSDRTYVDASLNLKPAITYVDASLNLKPSFTQVDASLNLKPAITYVDASLNLKANLASPTFTGTVTAPKLTSGDASFNGNVDISGVLSVKQTVNSVVTNTTINNYNVSVTNDLSLNGKLLVSSDVSLNSKLYVKGDASFNGRVDICGNFYAQYPAASIPSSAIIGGGGSSIDLSVDLSINGLTIGCGTNDISTNSVVGYQALLSNTTGRENSAFGFQALRDNSGGNFNSAFGFRALNTNTTGNNNSAVGNLALRSNTTGGSNSALGQAALTANTTGARNSSFGSGALFSNSTANDNTAIGNQTLTYNTTGAHNSAFGSLALWQNNANNNSALGYTALYTNITGGNNSAFGTEALRTNSTGGNNSAFGYQALYNNTTGRENTAIGDAAGFNNKTGTFNTFLGANTDVDSSGNTWTSSTAIGANALITASNQITLGTATETVRVPGKLSVIGDASFNGRVDICGNFYAQYPAASIPSSAIIGGAGGSSSGVDISTNQTVTGIKTFLNGMQIGSSNITPQSQLSLLRNFTKLGGDIDGEATTNQSGYSVSLNTDGTIVAIGAANNSTGYIGQVRIYQYKTIIETDWTNYTVNSFSFTGTSPNNKPIVVNDGDASPVSGKYYWVQLGGDIDGESSSSGSFTSVSISSDGSIVAIGASYNASQRGHVRVYKYQTVTETVWTNYTVGSFNYTNKPIVVNGGDATPVSGKYYWVQLGGDIDGEAGSDWFGRSVSLNVDGTILAVGANYNDGPAGSTVDAGSVRVYQYNGSTAWAQLGLDIDGEAASDFSGFSVSISADGSVVAIGAYFNGTGNTQRGHVRVYQYISSVWTKIGEDIDGEGTGNSTGYSVSMSSDGTIVAIGGGGATAPVRVYKYRTVTETVWTNYTVGGFSYTGISPTNKSIVANGADATPVSGKYYWVQMGVDIDSQIGIDYFGSSVSLSNDGTVLAVGAYKAVGSGPGVGDSGTVRLYKYNGSNWIQFGQDIEGETAGDYFGFSVSLSKDGNNVAIGAYFNDGASNAISNCGHVRVYKVIDTYSTLAINNNIDICGNFYAQYPANSIPASAVSFNTDININKITVGRGGNNSIYNAAFGYLALRSNTTGTVNNAFGHLALYSNTTGGSNNAFGHNTLYSNTTGSNNNAVGYYALRSNTTGVRNNAFGTNALTGNSTGMNNSAFGYEALRNNTTGNNNNAVGFEALRSNTTGTNNNAVGESALRSNTTGNYNSAFGNLALYSNTTGGFNIAVGSHSLYFNTNSNNTGIGYATLYNNTTGIENTAIGDAAGYNNTTGTYNTFLGANTDISGTTATWSSSTAIGANAKITASNQITLGVAATNVNILGTINAVTVGLGNGSVSTNSALGFQALFSNTIGSNNIAVGYAALHLNTTGSNNSAVGAEALKSNTTGSNNNAVGLQALLSNTTGEYNNAVGRSALRSNTAGNYNNAVGTEALRFNTTGSYNNALGYAALYSNTGNSNNAVGYAALHLNTTGTNNNSFGYFALFSNTTGSQNNAVGNDALRFNTTGISNSAFGTSALYSNTTGNYNNAVGESALRSNSTGAGNNAFGFNALYDNSGGNFNSAFGGGALRYNTTGLHNSAYGSNAGSANTTGTYNTFLGANTDISPTNATWSSSTAIGANAIITASNQITLGVAATNVNILGTINTLNIGRGGGNVSTNCAVGTSALNANTTGFGNGAFGIEALRFNTDGNANNAFGNGALYSNSTGGINSAFGYQALYSNTTGYYNSAFGAYALTASTGSNNSAFGFNALLVNTTGSRNSAFGFHSLRYNTTGIENTAIGDYAGQFNKTGSYNTFLGSGTDVDSSGNTWSNSTAIGADAIITASNQITLGVAGTNVNILGTINSLTVGRGPGNIDTNSAVGNGALLSNTTGSSNSAFGRLALGANTTGSSNGAFGRNALRNNTTGIENSAFGHNSLLANTTGNSNNAVGYQALGSNTGGSENNAFGNYALYYNTGGGGNNAFGASALRNNTTGFRNNAFGQDVLYSNTTGNFNSSFGYGALLVNTTGGRNSAFGNEALYYNTTGIENTAIGDAAGYFNKTGTYNTFLGANTDVDISSNTWSSSTAIGANAKITASNQITLGTATETVRVPGKLSMIGDASFNGRVDICGNFYAQYPAASIPSSAIIGGGGGGGGSSATDISVNSLTVGRGPGNVATNSAYGFQALLLNTTGANNTAIGYQAGDANTTGAFNTYLGAYADASGAAFSRSTAIGANARITASNQIVLGTSMETVSIPGNASFNGNVTISDISGNVLLNTNTGYYPIVIPIQLGQDIDGTSGYKLGNSVSMNSDGTIVAIGAMEANTQKGFVRVFKYDASKNTLVTNISSNDFGPIGWRRLGRDIDGEANSDYSGSSVSLSSDGLTVAIGAKNNDVGGVSTDNRGHVRVYKYDSAKLTNITDQSSNDFGPIGWRRLGQDIDGEAAGDQSGTSVSLSADGTIVAIGASQNDGTTGSATDNRGHVRVYKYDSAKTTNVTDQSSNDFGPIGWRRLGNDIDGEAAGDTSGTSVSLSTDGYTVAIGANQNNGIGATAGHVRVYRYDLAKTTSVTDQSSNAFGPIGWRRLGQDIDGEAASDYSGSSVSLSSDGLTVAIGAILNDGTSGLSTDYRGHVRVYKYDVNKLTNVTDQSSLDYGPIGWRRLGQDIDGEAANDQSGISVSLSADGTIVAIGGKLNDGTPFGGDRGHVRIYKYNGVVWNQICQDIDGKAAGDNCGTSVSLSADGTTVAIGANLYDAGFGLNDNRGHVRVFKIQSIITKLFINKQVEINGLTIGSANADISSNSAVGRQALNNIEVGYNNSVFGYQSLFLNVSGNNNSALGYQSGYLNIAGSNNTFVGSLADIDSNANTLSNSTAIGYNAKITASNQIKLGTLTEMVYVPGNLSLIGDASFNANINLSDGNGNVSLKSVRTDKYYTRINPLQLGKDIDGEAISNQSGYSVSMNRDGTIIAVGAILNSGNNGIQSGHVRVYKYDWTKLTNVTDQSSNDFGPIGWRRLGQDIDGEAPYNQSGQSVSLSSDGYTVAIGANFNGGSANNAGHVRVYKYDSAKLTNITDQSSNDFGPIGWRRLGQDIDGEAISDQSGISVSLSADGTIVAIGANQNAGTVGNASGHVRVYKYDASKNTLVTLQTSTDYGPIGWRRLGQDIDGEATSNRSGRSVSLSVDGTIVAIGAAGNTSSTGHVRVYKYDSAKLTNITDQSSNDFGPIGWRRLGQDIDGEAAGDQSGTSVSLSADGTIVAIGAPYNAATGISAGHVRIYKYDLAKLTNITDQSNNDFGPIGWRRLGNDIDAEAAGDWSGWSVSLSSDGTTVAIGAPYNRVVTVRGDVRIYKYINSAWQKICTDIDGEASGDQFGYSVSLSSDGTTVAIGANNNDETGTDAGHVRVYQIQTPINKLSINGQMEINGLTIGTVNTDISTNSVVGYQALNTNTTGFQNSAFGYQALLFNSSGNNNSAIGYQAGDLNTSGSNNTFLGSLADVDSSANAWSNSTAVGANAKITASNQITLGTATEVVSVPGWVSVVGNVTASSFPTSSDYRIKDYVTSLSDCSFTIDKLRPVSYHNKVTDKPDIGLIAHEVQEHFPFLVSGEKDGDTIQSVNYTSLISLLIHEIQQLKQETIPKLNQTIKLLEDRVQMLES